MSHLTYVTVESPKYLWGKIFDCKCCRLNHCSFEFLWLQLCSLCFIHLTQLCKIVFPFHTFLTFCFVAPSSQLKCRSLPHLKAFILSHNCLWLVDVLHFVILSPFFCNFFSLYLQFFHSFFIFRAIDVLFHAWLLRFPTDIQDLNPSHIAAVCTSYLICTCQSLDHQWTCLLIYKLLTVFVIYSKDCPVTFIVNVLLILTRFSEGMLFCSVK